MINLFIVVVILKTLDGATFAVINEHYMYKSRSGINKKCITMYRCIRMYLHR